MRAGPCFSSPSGCICCCTTQTCATRHDIRDMNPVLVFKDKVNILWQRLTRFNWSTHQMGENHACRFVPRWPSTTWSTLNPKDSNSLQKQCSPVFLWQRWKLSDLHERGKLCWSWRGLSRTHLQISFANKIERDRICTSVFPALRVWPRFCQILSRWWNKRIRRCSWVLTPNNLRLNAFLITDMNSSLHPHTVLHLWVK